MLATSIVQNAASIQFASSALAPLKIDSYRFSNSGVLCPSPSCQDVFFPWIRAQQYEMYKGTWFKVTYYSNGLYDRVPCISGVGGW